MDKVKKSWEKKYWRCRKGKSNYIDNRIDLILNIFKKKVIVKTSMNEVMDVLYIIYEKYFHKN